MKRGEIYYIATNFREYGHEQRAGRPAVIVSADDVPGAYDGTVQVVYMTTQPKTCSPAHVTTDSLVRTSTILCEQVTTVSTNRVGKYFGKLTAAEMMRVDDALAISLGLSKHEPVTFKREPTEAELENMLHDYIAKHGKISILEPDILPDIRVAKFEAERDVYKRLYEDLMKKITGGDEE